MVDRKSPVYLRSSFEEKSYGDDISFRHERELKVEGNDLTRVKYGAAFVQSKVMP